MTKYCGVAALSVLFFLSGPKQTVIINITKQVFLLPAIVC